MYSAEEFPCSHTLSFIVIIVIVLNGISVLPHMDHYSAGHGGLQGTPTA